MKKLTKALLAGRDYAASQLRDRRTDVDAAVEKYNAAKDEAYAKVTEAIEAYNDAIFVAWGDEVEPALEAYTEALGEAATWKSEVVAEIDNFIGDKSEKWLEGDRGQAYEAWKEQYEEDLEEVSLESPEPVEIEEPPSLDTSDWDDAADTLENLPEEVEG